MSTAQNTKARHYSALAARLNALNANLNETERLMGDMAEHLLAMRSLAAANAAQFMAASRLLDKDLLAHQEAADAAAPNMSANPNAYSYSSASANASP